MTAATIEFRTNEQSEVWMKFYPFDVGRHKGKTLTDPADFVRRMNAGYGWAKYRLAP